jgi:hypothetical protein
VNSLARKVLCTAGNWMNWCFSPLFRFLSETSGAHFQKLTSRLCMRRFVVVIVRIVRHPLKFAASFVSAMKVEVEVLNRHVATLIIHDTTMSRRAILYTKQEAGRHVQMVDITLDRVGNHR